MAAGVAGLSHLGEVTGVSALYETEPFGGLDQRAYLNAAVALETELGARALLEACLAIEAERGRERRVRWGPRTLDLDLLLYGREEVDEPGLTVPHPGLPLRRFALEPLVDAWPDAVLPDGTPVADLLEAVGDQQVERLPDRDWWVDDLS